jgi:hypothetical protein
MFLAFIWITVLCVCWAYDTDIEYRLNNNYATEVIAFGGRCNAKKLDHGDPNTIVTPYGLYLSGTQIQLSPNDYSACAPTSSMLSYAFTVFVRYLPGIAGTTPREVLTLQSPTNIRFQIRQSNQAETSSPIWEFQYTKDGADATISSSQSDGLSKLYTDHWHFIMFRSMTLPSNRVMLDFCIDGSLVGYGLTTPTNDWTNNYLNGPKTRGIYYRLNYRYNTETSCDETPGFSLTLSGSPCSYVCPGLTEGICEVDSYTYDSECQDCGTACGDYGCEQDSGPLTCYTDICPPVVQYTVEINNQNCKACYANTKVTTEGEPACICEDKFFKVADNPLDCKGKR